MLVTPEKKMGREREDATEFFREMIGSERMMRGDDFEFPGSFLKATLKLLDIVKMNQFFFDGEVVRCPEAADNDSFVFEVIRRPGTKEF